MIDWWLVQADALIVGVIAVLYGLQAALLLGFCFHPRWRAVCDSFAGVVAPFISFGCVAFALVAGFMGASVWGRFNETELAVRDEAAAALQLIRLSEATPQFRAAGLIPLTDRYLQVVVEEEWPLLHVRGMSRDAAQAHFRLQSKALGVVTGGEVGPLLSGELLRSVNELSRARIKRSNVAQGEHHFMRWLGLLTLGLLAQCGVAAVHLKHKRGMGLALTISSLVIVTPVSMLALSASPFSGSMSVPSDPLTRVLQRPTLTP